MVSPKDDFLAEAAAIRRANEAALMKERFDAAKAEVAAREARDADRERRNAEFGVVDRLSRVAVAVRWIACVAYGVGLIVIAIRWGLIAEGLWSALLAVVLLTFGAALLWVLGWQLTATIELIKRSSGDGGMTGN